MALIWCLLICLPVVSAFTSTGLYSRPVLFNGIETSVTTASFTASNLDSTGTFQLELNGGAGGCSGHVSVQPPQLSYVVTHIANVPYDSISFEEVSCVVTSLSAYRKALSASGETLDVSLEQDADNTTIHYGNTSSSAFRRRLLQSSTPSANPIVTSFAATSKVRDDEAHESLNYLDRDLFATIASYVPVNFAVSSPVLALGGANQNDEALRNAQQRQLDVDKKLVQRGQNTDAAVDYLTSFVINAYLDQQTNLVQLFAAQAATNDSITYLYNAVMQIIRNDITLNTYTAKAIQGLLDYRLSDLSKLQQFIDNNELKDLANLLYRYDVSQLPPDFAPFVRNPGVAPNASLGSSILLDVLTQSGVTTTSTSDKAYAYYGKTAIYQNTFSTRMSATTALLLPGDQLDSRLLLGLFSSQICTPPGLNPNISYILPSQALYGYYFDLGLQDPYVAGPSQVFNTSSTPCDVWVEARICHCTWDTSNGGPATFRWNNHPDFAAGKNPALSDICSNKGYTNGQTGQYTCFDTVITTVNQLTDALNVDLCSPYCRSDRPGHPYTSPICNSPFSIQYGGFTSPDQIDLTYFSSETLQLRGNTTVRDCPLYSPAAYNITTGWAPEYLNWTVLQGGTNGITNNYLATVVAGFVGSTAALSQLRLQKYGRIAGVETVTVPSNLYLQPQFDAQDGPATPLRCEKSFWNAYSTQMIPLYSFQINSAQIVTNNIAVNITCPPCTTSFCYDPSASVATNVLNYDTGSFILDSSFLFLGSLSTLGKGGSFIYDVPNAQLSASPIIEARAFTPTYISVPPDVTTMPSWVDFVAMQPRNVRYSAAYGTLSPQAWKQATTTTPSGQVVCSSNDTAAIPGSHACVLLRHYNFSSYSSSTSLAAFSPVAWQVSFSVSSLSGVYRDVVDVSDGCPIVTLQPTASGSLTLALQNDDVSVSSLVVTYRPKDISTDIPCPSICCSVPGFNVVALPRFTTYFDIPACGWINLTITVKSSQGDGSALSCFNATGSSLFNLLQNAATAFGVNNFFNTVNYTMLYANAVADFYAQEAYQSLIDYQLAQQDFSERGRSLLAALIARRDHFAKQIFEAQQLAPLPATFPLDVNILNETITGLLTNNTAIDKAILTIDIPYMEGELAKIDTSITNVLTGEQCSLNPLTWITCVKDMGDAVGKALVDGGKDALKALQNLLDDDDGCPTGWQNIVHPIDGFKCLLDDLIGVFIGVGVILVFGLLVVCCAPNIVGFVSHKLLQSAEAYRVQKGKHKKRGKARATKEKAKPKATYDQVSSQDSSSDG